MKQQQTFRGFMFIILMLILLMLALRFPYARQAQTVTAQEFEQILGSGNVAEAVISPNPQTPSGYVTVTLANGQTVRQNVSDVKDAEQLLKDNSIDYSMEDVPQENTLLTVVMPFMLSIVVVVVIVTMMNRGAAGGGSNARMMNFGRSRAKLSRDSKVNFSNVAGLVEEKEELEEIVKIVLEKDLFVISDEIYSELTYNGKRHVTIASFPGMKERTVLINGFSKAYAMTGWRLGYAAAPAAILEQMLKIHQYAIMCAPTTSQYAAVTALRRCDADIEAMRSEYDMRRRFLVSSLNRMGLDCFEPEGAFYAFPSIRKTGLSSEEFCEKLLFGKKVAVVPGNAFGDSGEGHVRISYSYSIGHLSEALHRIELFLQELGV